MNSENSQSHSVYMQDCKRAELSGISEVESFNETGIDLASCFGGISIEGDALKIEHFSVESGKIAITGHITGVFYYDKPDKNGAHRGGFFARRPK